MLVDNESIEELFGENASSVYYEKLKNNHEMQNLVENELLKLETTDFVNSKDMKTISKKQVRL